MPLTTLLLPSASENRYKTPDGKPINGFGHGERALSAAEAADVIDQTHEHYLNLMAGHAEKGKLWLPDY